MGWGGAVQSRRAACWEERRGRRQEDRAAGTKGSYGVSHSLVSRSRPEGGGWGLDVSGEVERVALQFGKGDGRMLQVVQQHLDLRGDRKRKILLLQSSYPLLK